MDDTARVRLGLVLPDGPRRFERGEGVGSPVHCWVHDILRDLPETPLRRGDLLFYFLPHSMHRNRPRSEIRARIRGELQRVARSAFPVILANRRFVPVIAGTVYPEQPSSVDSMFAYLAQWRHRDFFDDSGPLWVVRPRHKITEPIRAVHDIDAMEQLLEGVVKEH